MKFPTVLFTVTFLAGSGGLLSAAPQLRLSTAAVGPIFIAPGQNGPAQSVTATNVGDGTLALAASSNAPWLTASIASNTVQIGFTTSTLAPGAYSGVVAVSAPGAIDAPQNIAVSIQIGSAIPNSVDIYLPPGGTGSVQFPTSSAMFANATNPKGGVSLSVIPYGGSFFSSTFALKVTAAAPAGTPEGDYAGSVTTFGSTFAADNKTFQVTAHVTSQPIAEFSPANLTFRIASGAAPVTQAVGFSNLGSGALAVSTVGVTASWLTATTQGNFVLLTATPGSMSPGVYQTTVSVVSNAKNGPSSIPVELDVLATAPPVAYYQGVLDNALFAVGDPLAPGGIVALFGEQLTAGPITQAQKLPLGTSLGGATVLVNGQAAPIYYVSANQIDFVIPYGTKIGKAVVQVQRDGQTGNSVGVTIQAAVPRLLRLGIGDYGIAVLSDNITFAMPATPGILSSPAKAGVDTVVFYALGLGQTNPPAQDGQASGANQVAPIQAVIGQSIFPGTGVTVTPAYAGLTPGSVGLYQINVPIPANSQRGSAIPVYLDFGGGVISNRVDIAIQ